MFVIKLKVGRIKVTLYFGLRALIFIGFLMVKIVIGVADMFYALLVFMNSTFSSAIDLLLPTVSEPELLPKVL